MSDKQQIDNMDAGLRLALMRVFEELKKPFPLTEIKYKPQTISGNRAMVVHFIDARHVIERLNDFIGPWNWQDEYESLENGSVRCRLSLRINGEWITKCDVGEPSKQPDEGDRCKAAHSDALKRAAVKWWIGLYLYRLPQQWCDYDPQKKRLVKVPELPDWALTPEDLAARKAKPPQPAAQQAQQSQPAAKPAPQLPSAFISPTQVSELAKSMNNDEECLNKLLKVYAIPGLEKLPLMHLDDAKERVKRFLAAKKSQHHAAK